MRLFVAWYRCVPQNLIPPNVLLPCVRGGQSEPSLRHLASALLSPIVTAGHRAEGLEPWDLPVGVAISLTAALHMHAAECEQLRNAVLLEVLLPVPATSPLALFTQLNRHASMVESTAAGAVGCRDICAGCCAVPGAAAAAAAAAAVSGSEPGPGASAPSTGAAAAATGGAAAASSHGAMCRRVSPRSKWGHVCRHAAGVCAC